MGCLLFFSLYLNGLGEKYPELFEGGGDGSETAARFGKKWRGYQSVVELAGGDITKIDAIVKEPLEKCLLLLAYKSDYAYLQTQLNKEYLKKA
jgi:hypothetical protein